MSLLEFAERTSPTPLTAWQREFLTKYETAVKENKVLVCYMPRSIGYTRIKNLVNQFYGKPVTK